MDSVGVLDRDAPVINNPLTVSQGDVRARRYRSGAPPEEI